MSAKIRLFLQTTQRNQQTLASTSQKILSKHTCRTIPRIRNKTSPWKHSKPFLILRSTRLNTSRANHARRADSPHKNNKPKPSMSKFRQTDRLEFSADTKHTRYQQTK